MKLLRLIARWLLMAIWLPVTPITLADEIDASLLQMLYLRNFIAYSEWPQSHAPTILAVIGDPALQATLASMQQQHAFALDSIRYCDTSSCAVGADVIFIGQDFDNTKVLLRTIAGRNVLTVSNQPRFIDHGGMIGLVRRNHRLRFEVNLTAVHHANMRISAELLQMAIRIIGTNNR